MSQPRKPRVIVVGGGYGGVRACKELQGSFEIDLVDPKDFFEATHSPAMMVHPEASNGYLLPLPSKGVRHVRDAAAGIASDGRTGEVALRSGASLPFDYAVLALGAAYPPFKTGAASLTAAERRAAFTGLHDRIAAARSVVVVGGGNVGVELAAEIADSPGWRQQQQQQQQQQRGQGGGGGKRLTLVAGPFDRLLPRMDKKAGDFAARFLAARGVEVLLGHSVTDWGGLSEQQPAASDVTLRTDKGALLEADLAVRALGPRPATAAIAGSLSPEQLAPNGALLVEDTLQVKGWPNVLAVGDCAALDREATANFADIEGLVAANNIKLLAAGAPGSKLQTYPAGLFGARKLPYVGGCALGRREGVFQLGRSVQTGWGPAASRATVDQLMSWYVSGTVVLGCAYRQLKRLIVVAIGREARALGAAGAAAADAAG